jgi:hypothetical protein
LLLQELQPLGLLPVPLSHQELRGLSSLSRVDWPWWSDGKVYGVIVPPHKPISQFLRDASYEDTVSFVLKCLSLLSSLESVSAVHFSLDESSLVEVDGGPFVLHVDFMRTTLSGQCKEGPFSSSSICKDPSICDRLSLGKMLAQRLTDPRLKCYAHALVALSNGHFVVKLPDLYDAVERELECSVIGEKDSKEIIDPLVEAIDRFETNVIISNTSAIPYFILSSKYEMLHLYDEATDLLSKVLASDLEGPAVVSRLKRLTNSMHYGCHVHFESDFGSIASATSCETLLGLPPVLTFALPASLELVRNVTKCWMQLFVSRITPQERSNLQFSFSSVFEEPRRLRIAYMSPYLMTMHSAEDSMREYLSISRCLTGLGL